MSKNIHSNFTAKKGRQEVVVTSLIEASRGRVFQAYTDPRLIPCFWGPARLTTKVQKMNIRPGGEWRFIQYDAGDRPYAFHGVYREVLPPERLVYTFEYEGTPGKTVTETVTFEERGGRTKITDRAWFPSVVDRDEMLRSGMEEGAIETYERLAELVGNIEKAEAAPGSDPLPGVEIVMTRDLGAPRERVWRAWTEPELIKGWWGPRGFSTPFVENNLCIGSRYLYCMRSSEGKDYWSTGTYREIVPPERITATDSFADALGNIVPASYYGFEGDFPLAMLVTVEFEENGGRTRLTVRQSGHPTADEAELARAGWNQMLDKLEAIVAAGG